MIKKRLLQTRVPVPLANWIRAQAKKNGMTVATYLRNHLINYAKETQAQERLDKKEAAEEIPFG